MKTITWQATTSLVIAVLTTLLTTAFTSYLLARPWCIQIESDTRQRILYGSDNCSPGEPHPHQRNLAQDRKLRKNSHSTYQEL